jgi:hypothetical protein
MAGLLDRLQRSLKGRSDEDLVGEVERLRLERRALLREHPRFRESAHEAVDETVRLARVRLEGELARLADVQAPVRPDDQTGGGDLVARIGALAAFCDPRVAELWHAAVDAAPAGTFSEMTRAEVQERAARLAGEIRDREVELERRRVAAEQAELDAELATLESRGA